MEDQIACWPAVYVVIPVCWDRLYLYLLWVSG